MLDSFALLWIVTALSTAALLIVVVTGQVLLRWCRDLRSAVLDRAAGHRRLPAPFSWTA